MNYLESEGKATVFLHTHTDLGSPKDSILTVDKYVKKALEMGATAIAVTDHGTMYAIQDAYGLCNENNINLIVGVEFYVCDTVEDVERKKHIRLHLCAYAKNNTGYKVLCKLVTESNKRIVTSSGGLSFPCISKALLEKYLGPNTPGHENVILTSACIGGVLTGLISVNNENLRELEKAKKTVNNYEIYLDSIKKTQKEINDISSAIEITKKKKEESDTLAKKSFVKMNNMLKKDPSNEQLAEEIKKDKEKSLKAKEYSVLAAEEIKKANVMLKEKKLVIKHIFEDIMKQSKLPFVDESILINLINKCNVRCNDIEKEIFPESQIEQIFEREMLWYKKIAGAGNWLIEMQYHGLADEKKYMFTLAQLAEKHHIPIIAANDAHMAERDDCITRKYINALRFNKWDEPNESEYEMYLKDDKELFTMLSSAITEKYAIKAMNNREIVASLCNVSFNKEPHYPKFPIEEGA